MTTPTPNYWYHQHTKRLISAFGQVFSQFRVAKFDETGTLKQVVGPVPILNRLGDPELRRSIIQATDNGALDSKGIAIFPRMGYQLTGLNYASSRAQPSTNRMLYPTGNPSTSTTVNVVNVPVPWNYTFELIGVARTSSDCYQLVEQILPMFNPTLTIVMIDDPVVGEHCDVKLRLTDVNITDNGLNPAQDVSREVVFTMQITAEYHLYGPAGTLLEEQVLTAVNGGTDTPSSAIRPSINNYVIDAFLDPSGFYESSNAALQWVVIEIDGVQQDLAIDPPDTY